MGSKQWFKLYAIVPLAVGLFMLGHILHLTPADHKLVLLLFAAFIYGLIGVWIKSNSALLEDQADEDIRQSRSSLVVGAQKMSEEHRRSWSVRGFSIK